MLARDQLATGFECEGPLVLEEQTSTVVVDPGWKVRRWRGQPDAPEIKVGL